MSLTTRNPLRMAGANLSSGWNNTGQVPMTQGGQQTACVFSGAIAMGVAAAGTGALSSGGSILIFSGAGRLDTFTALWPAGVALAGHGELGAISGQAIVVYDSAITARSGLLTDSTIAESGRKILYSWMPPRVFTSGGGESIQGSFDPKPLQIPFFSGLAVMALSGAAGFSIAYTPNVDPTNPFTA